MLFASGNLGDHLDARRAQMVAEVEADTTLEAADENTYVTAAVAKWTLTPVTLDLAAATVDADTHDTRSRTFTVTIPFAGDAILLRLQPTTHLGARIPGTVTGRRITVDLADTDADSDDVQDRYDFWLARLQEQLTHTTSQVATFNTVTLPDWAHATFQQRQAALAATTTMLDILDPSP